MFLSPPPIHPPSLITQVDADSFYTACNGHPFNSIEDAVCQLIYVERAEVIKSEEVPVIPWGVGTAGSKSQAFLAYVEIEFCERMKKDM